MKKSLIFFTFNVDSKGQGCDHIKATFRPMRIFVILFPVYVLTSLELDFELLSVITTGRACGGSRREAALGSIPP